jgi:hypothetical protein
MENVIYVDFAGSAQLSERACYMNLLRAELDPNDVQDFIEAVADPAYYQTLDEDMQNLVDGYFACKA